jgi:DNA-binding HxlR family transcriptional regulator
MTTNPSPLALDSPTPPGTLALLDLFGRRWALRIVWELRAGPLSFRDLQARCDAMSTSVLTRRLIELREAVVIERAADGAYHLSPSGEELLAGLRRWEEWAERHAAAPTNGDAPAAG